MFFLLKILWHTGCIQKYISNLSANLYRWCALWTLGYEWWVCISYAGIPVVCASLHVYLYCLFWNLNFTQLLIASLPFVTQRYNKTTISFLLSSFLMLPNYHHFFALSLPSICFLWPFFYSPSPFCFLFFFISISFFSPLLVYFLINAWLVCVFNRLQRY